MDIKDVLEKVNQTLDTERIDRITFKRHLEFIKEAIECMKDYQGSNDMINFIKFYTLAFDNLKKMLHFLQTNPPNPGLMNALSIVCVVVENALKGVKLNDSNSELLMSISKLVYDGRIILLNEYNR